MTNIINGVLGPSSYDVYYEVTTAAGGTPLSKAAWSAARDRTRDDFETAAAIVAASHLTYANVTAGQFVAARNGERLEAAATGASDHHFTGAGGVKFYEAGPGFTTRARLEAAKTRGLSWQDGQIISASGVFFQAESGNTSLPNLSGLKRFGPADAKHFGDTDFNIHVEDFLGDELRFVLKNDIANQDAAVVRAGIQAAHNAVMTAAMEAVTASEAFHIICRMPAGTMAVDGELFDETFAQNLWDTSFDSESVFQWEAPATTIKCVGFSSHAAVRTSGLYARESITDPVPKVLFRWEQSEKASIGPYIRGLKMVGESALTDPIPYKTFNANIQRIDDMQMQDFRATGFFGESMNNSRYTGLRIRRCGWQPTMANATGRLSSTVRVSCTANTGLGTSTIVADENIFAADQVGDWVLVTDAGQGGSVFSAQISTYTSATTVDVNAECSVDVTDEVISFTHLTGTISADSNSLALDRQIDEDMIGRYVTVYGCSSKLYDEQSCLTTRVVGQSGATLLLATEARLTATNTPVIVSPSMFVGYSDDATNAGVAFTNHNNDLLFQDAQVEFSIEEDRGSAVPLVATTWLGNSVVGSKFHGSAPAYTNYGAGGAGMILDNCKTTSFVDCTAEWGEWDPVTLGRVTACGTRCGVELIGFKWGSNKVLDRVTNFYIDPLTGSDWGDFKLSAGGFDNGKAGQRGLTNQNFVKYGTNGEARMWIANGPMVFREEENFDNMPAIVGSAARFYGTSDYVPSFTQNGNDVFAGNTDVDVEVWFGSDELTTVGGTYGLQRSRMTRIGDIVFAHIDIEVESLGTASGACYIYVPSEWAAEYDWGGVICTRFERMNGISVPPTGVFTSPDNRLSIINGGDGGTLVQATNWNPGGSGSESRLIFTGTYRLKT